MSGLSYQLPIKPGMHPRSIQIGILFKLNLQVLKTHTYKKLYKPAFSEHYCTTHILLIKVKTKHMVACFYTNLAIHKPSYTQTLAYRYIDWSSFLDFQIYFWIKLAMHLFVIFGRLRLVTPTRFLPKESNRP